ncbi:MAG TPA: hypothetical protein PLW99_00315 [Candidatus Paceibacterota bacterium]|nr:MAG: hypothetical protein B7X03_02105 [Parcubacteria group bacterium 21-58-10]OYV83245.1 MAG: hypothetical protein B7W96_00195 [Parcubacteria group bacterium 37-58-5]HQT82589.1 hypothetical protein [Candidatus Paceibacterota bacterium]
MPQQFSEDDTSSLERAREHLYTPATGSAGLRRPLPAPDEEELPHEWAGEPLQEIASHKGKRHVRLASIFLGAAFAFFLVSLAIAVYVFYVGGNSVSVDKVSVNVQGPTTIAGGDIVPLSLTITNTNSSAIENATVEIDFPNGTRSAANVLTTYPTYTENLGTIGSGETVTRSVKAVLFGSSGQALTLPISFSYGTAGSNAVFVKKSSYSLTVSSTPLSVSVQTLSETVSGQPLTLTLIVNSNATVPLSNVVLTGNLPFGFQVTSSSVPLNNSSFLLGTLAPGASKTITLTGTLAGQDGEQRVFTFTVGTANTPGNQSLAVTYMSQQAAVSITAPFINTTLAINGNSSPNVVLAPGSPQNVTLSYTNTLPTSITNASVSIALSGAAIDYNSVQTTNGFYNSVNHTVIFSKDTDPSLALLSPGATGVGVFTFSTLPTSASVASPAATFGISVSGTRLGQTNVPEQVSAFATQTAKVTTTVALSASALHTSGPLATVGPIPPVAGQATTYTVVWGVQDKGSAVAGGTVSATLPSYVTYTGATAGAGSFSYDNSSRTVTWSVGDLTQGGNAQGAFQVSLTPSTSQKGGAPALTGAASFTGYDRFAGVQVSATADPATTETQGDPGYVSTNSIVQ